MKITINRDECTSCGTCWETCPDIFKESPVDSLNQIVEKYRLKGNIAEGVPPEAYEDCFRESSGTLLCRGHLYRRIRKVEKIW